MTPRRDPPRLAERLLERLLPEGLCRDGVLGDLAEEHRRGRPSTAALFYWVRSLSIVASFARERLAARWRGRLARRRRRTGVRGEGVMRVLLQELGGAVRALRSSPGFAVAASVILAVGIGANTAIVSVIQGVLFQPLPYAEPADLVAVWEVMEEDGGKLWRVSPANFLDWRERSRAFSDMAAFGAAGYTLTGAGEPELILGARVTAEYFGLLGVAPALGRVFTAAESADASSRVILLGDGLWRRRFAGDPEIVGRTLTLDGEPYTVVGVLPPGLYPTWPSASEGIAFEPGYQQFWVPVHFAPEAKSNRGLSHVHGVLARLRDGVSLSEARRDMAAVAASLATDFPANVGVGARVVPLGDELVGEVRPALLMLLAAVGLVLLLVCANVAHLVLARASGREGELALRAALGASRGRLVAQLLTESTLLALVGGSLGAAGAAVSVRLLPRLVPIEVPGLATVELDHGTLVATLLVTLVTGLLCGLLPALAVTRGELGALLPQGHRGSLTGVAGLPIRRVLVIGQVALAILLVIGGSLLVRSFQSLQRVDPGFDPSGVALLDLALPASKYDEPHRVSAFFDELLERARSLDGVAAAALAYDHPLEASWVNPFTIAGREDEGSVLARFRSISPDYFRAAGIRLLEGRDFAPSDDARHPGVAIVNRELARRSMPAGNAIGSRIVTRAPALWWGQGPGEAPDQKGPVEAPDQKGPVGAPDQKGPVGAPDRKALPSEFEIVGVVDDVRFLGLQGAAEPAYYLPAAQFPIQEMSLLVRGEGDPRALLPALREVVWAIDRDQPVASSTTLARVYAEALARPRFSAVLMGSFGGLGLGVAALGIYSLLAYTVSRRRREIGLRLALGARPGDVVRLVVGEGLALTGAGIGMGLAAALPSTRLLSSLLYEIEPRDPWSFGVVPVLLLLVALLASLVPALRASRLDPMATLERGS